MKEVKGELTAGGVQGPAGCLGIAIWDGVSRETLRISTRGSRFK